MVPSASPKFDLCACFASRWATNSCFSSLVGGGKDSARRTALAGDGNPGAVALLVEGQLAARNDVGALECVLGCGDFEVLGARILNQ